MQRHRHQGSFPAPGDPDKRTGQLDAFEVLQGTLRAATVQAVASRLRAGQTAERIRREVPEVAARMAERRFPSAMGFHESVHAFVLGLVEAELGRAESSQHTRINE